MAKNKSTAQDGTNQFQVKGVKPSDLPTKTPYEMNTGNKGATNNKSQD